MLFQDNLEDEIEREKLKFLDLFYSTECNLIVCIENYDDEPFWQFIFSKIENIKPIFKPLDGKLNILKFEALFDNEFIACVDSDYDYILKKPYLDNPYIFHTYVYSVENHCLCLNTLNDLKVTCNIVTTIDFKSLLEKISVILKDALLYDIYLKDTSQECQREVFNFTSISNQNLNETFILNHLEVQVNTMLEGIDKSVFAFYENRINNDLYLHKNFVYLYIEGHILFDSLLHLFKELQIQSSQCRREEIKDKYSGQLRGDKLNEIKNKEFDIESILRINYKEAYYDSKSSMHYIIRDIQTQSLGVSL